MKRSYLILVLLGLLCAGCKHQPAIVDSCKIVHKGAKIYDLCIDQRFISKPHDTAVANHKFTIINVPVWFSNNSDDSLNYMDWSGYREAVFSIDNKKIKFLLHVIDANMLSYFTVKAHQKEKYNFHLEFNKDSIYSNNHFRIGIDIIKVGKEGVKAHLIKNGDTSRFIKGSTIWSNPVKVPLN